MRGVFPIRGQRHLLAPERGIRTTAAQADQGEAGENKVGEFHGESGNALTMERVLTEGIRQSLLRPRNNRQLRRQPTESGRENDRMRMRKEARSKPPGYFYDACRWLWLGIFGFTMRVFSDGLQG